MPDEPSDTIGALTDAALATFLAEPWNGRLATITPAGWPYVAPVWYEFERDRRAVLVVGRERAQWIAHLRVNPRVAFHVADDLHVGYPSPSATPRTIPNARSTSN
jgi:nitroimidazol reductase NimA-like FMN-containing flavoprotein (pyridoxamine 5'-phosphate oxidase superfamily)